MSEVICKGCKALGTNCGKCSRCYQEAQSELSALWEELIKSYADHIRKNTEFGQAKRELEDRLAAAEQRNAELEKYAKRYEVLRGGSLESDDSRGLLCVWDWRGCEYEELGVALSGENLDKTLDEFLSGESKIRYYVEPEAGK